MGGLTYITGTGQIITNVHAPDKCEEPWCVIHNPVPGPWNDWKTHWRGDQRIIVELRGQILEVPVDIWRGFERRCPHNVGHTAVEEILRGNKHMHGCGCGCPCGIRDAYVDLVDKEREQ